MKKETQSDKNFSQTRTVENYFFDIVVFSLSFVFSFVRSFVYFFSLKNLTKSKNYFFDFLDFGFKIWPRYFWENPNLYKITAFLGGLIGSIFTPKK